LKDSSTEKQERIAWRRNKVFELATKGMTQADIARALQISESTISRDIDLLKKQASESIKEHISERLPYEYNKCIAGLDEIIREGWLISTSRDNKEKLSSLSLIKDAYSTKMDLLTNANLLQDSIKFVASHSHRGKISHSTLDLGKEDDLEGPAETDPVV